MTDANLNSTLETGLQTTVGQIAEDLSQLLALEIEIDATAMELVAVTSIFPGAGTHGAVCARASFARKGNGVGGILLGALAANRLSHAAMMMDPPEDGDPINWDGLVREAMDEIFNILVGSWNNTSAADLRMGGSVEERSVEYYSANSSIPEAAGVVPICACMPMKIGEIQEQIAFFLPINAVHGPAVRGFSVPEGFTKNLGDGGSSGTVSAEEPAVVAPPRYDGPVRPVVFVDYTGSVVAWIRQQAALARFKVYKSTGPSSDTNPDEPPAATVLVGLNPADLPELNELPFVEIRPLE